MVATWRTPDGVLRAWEPAEDDVARAAPLLAGYYNEPYNRSMMANTVAMGEADVREHFRGLHQGGGRAFLLERDGDLLGDADFRHVDATSAEFAILIGRRREQGKGLGLACAILLHALAFRVFRWDRVFVAIIPANLPSQRMFAKLGYVADSSPAALRFAEAATDLTFSLGRQAFEASFAACADAITCRPR